MQSKQIMNARGMPGIMQVGCIPRLWPGPGLGLKLWSQGLGLWAGPGPWARAPGPGRRRPGTRREAAWARAQGPGAQGMPKAQGPASSTDANALALFHDDSIIHMSAIPNPIIECLCIGPSKECPNLKCSPYVQWCVKRRKDFFRTLSHAVSLSSEILSSTGVTCRQQRHHYKWPQEIESK